MKAAFYAGSVGLIANQEMMDSIGHNIANSNTVGYKSMGVAFRSLLYTNMYANAPSAPLAGYGSRAVSTGVNFEQSALMPSGFLLDFAISGDGLFAVQNGTNGQTQYTRDGSFAIGLEGNSAYLVAANGDYVLDANRQRIQLQYIPGTDKIDYTPIKDQLGVFSFDNPTFLEPLSSNRFTPTAQSGAARLSVNSQIRAGALEQSGTSLTDELSDMITAQRSYQMCAKVVQTADENEQTINNLRK